MTSELVRTKSNRILSANDYPEATILALSPRMRAMDNSGEDSDEDADIEAFLGSVDEEVLDIDQAYQEPPNESTPLQRSVTSASEVLARARVSNENLPFYKRPAVLMICTVEFLFFFAIGVSGASELILILEAVCSKVDPGHCDSSLVQNANAQAQKWYALTSVINVLVSGKVGQLSDIYGRRPAVLFVMLCCLASGIVEYIVLQPENFSVFKLLLAGCIQSFGGSVFVLVAIGNSYVVDVVPENERMQAIGQLSAYYNFGMGAGPLVASFCGLPPRVNFQVSIGLMAITFVVTFAFLPESRPMRLKDRSRRMSQESATQASDSIPRKLGFGSIVDSIGSLRLLWITRHNSDGTLDYASRFNVIFLLCINAIFFTAGLGLGMPKVLYAGYTFHWDVTLTSLYMGLSMSLRALVLLLFSPWLYKLFVSIFQKHSKRVDYIDLFTFSFSLISDMFVEVSCICASNTSTFFISTIFVGFASLGMPTLHSTLVKYSPSSAQNGEFFGAIALITNFLALLAPVLGLTLYQFSVSIDPKLIFYVGLAFYISALSLVFFIRI